MIFAFLAVAVYVGVCAILARNYIHPFRRVPVRPEWVREVTIESRFGPTPAWCTEGLASGHPSKVVFVMAHGYGGTRGTWAEPMRELYAKGFDSVAISMPGQDASPAADVGFGISESQALVDAVRWARSRGSGKVVLLGVSMGGAACWLASALDHTVDGVVTEGAYARFDEATKTFLDCKVKGGSVALAPVIPIARLMTGLDPRTVRPVDAAEAWKGKPALVIQAGDDVLILGDQAKSLASAAGCDEWLVPGAQHAECFSAAPQEYVKRLTEFAGRL